MASVVTIPPSQSAADRQALNEANFQRNVDDQAPLAGEELERFNLRREAAQRRDRQLMMLDSALSEREARAEELATTLREAGLHNVAERARRSGASPSIQRGTARHRWWFGRY